MARIVSPPIDQHHKLRQPLTDGEKLVFEFFNQNLNAEWEIYLQPHMNGLRPDIVLLNPRAGIAVFEIKDWNLDALDYWLDTGPGRNPQLMAMNKDGKKFSKQKENPIPQVLRYKKEIYELYCPRLETKSGLGLITAGVIFPYADTETTKKLLSPCLAHLNMTNPEYLYPISGADSLATGNLRAVFPYCYKIDGRMKEVMAKDLRHWLVEPDFSAAQRQPLEIDATQKSYVLSRTETGYRRIKGPAGSGKSLILAARAAQLLGEGKEVLVVTFNLTLLHYLMDLAVRWPIEQGAARKNITWLNFHQWCKRVCFDADCEDEYYEYWARSDGESNRDDKILAKLVSRIIDEDRDEFVARYDAVLVDEGQDFYPEWWNALRKVCHPEGEMLLVADATQDIYGTARSWTDEAMLGAGFTGAWAELKSCYRLPSDALIYARKFAEEFLPDDIADLPVQAELQLNPCTLKWVQTSQTDSIDRCMEEVFRLLPTTDEEILAMADITFLTDSEKFGLEFMKTAASYGIRVVHTFGDTSEESRRKKIGFYMGDARVKATTLHSFKGWESRAIVIFAERASTDRALALIYSGLTRLKRHTAGSHLTVISSAKELESYGRKWPQFESHD